MKPTYFGLIVHKSRTLTLKWRLIIFKLRGLQIKKGSTLGKISCDWPNSLSIGLNCVIQDNVDFRIWHPYEINSYIKIGDNVFIGHGSAFACASKITIGDNCLIASGCSFIDGGHEYSKFSYINTQPMIVEEITIHEDVWIGMSCSILKGVTIGKGSVIGAG